MSDDESSVLSRDSNISEKSISEIQSEILNNLRIQLALHKIRKYVKSKRTFKSSSRQRYNI